MGARLLDFPSEPIVVPLSCPAELSPEEHCGAEHKSVLSLRRMLRAVSAKPRVLRFIAVIVAIAAMLCVSAASVSAAHSHVKEPVDRCGVCQTAHMAAKQVAFIRIPHAPELQSLLAPAVIVQRIESRTVLVILTRGPPAAC